MSYAKPMQFDGGMRKASGPDRPSQARIVLPREDMERVRQVARALGLSLSAYLRLAVMERTMEHERRPKR
jgi:hypothetical protein